MTTNDIDEKNISSHNAGETNVVVTPKILKKSQWGNIWYRFKKNKLAMLGLFIFAFFLLIAIFTGVFFDYRKNAISQNMPQRLIAPSREHIFGTDQYGRDVFVRVYCLR